MLIACCWCVCAPFFFPLSLFFSSLFSIIYSVFFLLSSFFFCYRTCLATAPFLPCAIGGSLRLPPAFRVSRRRRRSEGSLSLSPPFCTLCARQVDRTRDQPFGQSHRCTDTRPGLLDSHSYSEEDGQFYFTRVKLSEACRTGQTLQFELDS